MSLDQRLTVSLEITKTLAAIAVPVVIAIIGNEYTATIKDSENRVRYVELAVATLRAEPSPENKALREWAIELLASQSPIGLTEAARKELSLRPIPLHGNASGVALASGSAIITNGASTSTTK